MKRAITLAAGLLALALCLTSALAAGGGAGDPLISLSYLENTFTASADAAIDSRLDSADAALQSALQQQLDAAGQAVSPEAQELTLKAGDTITGTTGLTLVPLSGDLQLTMTAGTAVDVTDGAEVSGGLLAARHRYIVAENAAAVVTVTSPTAVLACQGSHTLALSSTAPDYFAIARALRDLGLFQGAGTSFGEGFDLHCAPTRAEGLVMFIRILGEEAEALSCAYTHPFTDVPTWLDRYVAWACHRGYTNGVGGGLFGTSQTISAVEYEEFLLRALQYSVAGVHDYTTSLSRAVSCGALSAGEYQLLQEEPFLRAHVAYLSYYSLDTIISGSQLTLAQHLENIGLFTEDQLASARTQVNSQRVI